MKYLPDLPKKQRCATLYFLIAGTIGILPGLLGLFIFSISLISQIMEPNLRGYIDLCFTLCFISILVYGFFLYVCYWRLLLWQRSNLFFRTFCWKHSLILNGAGLLFCLGFFANLFFTQSTERFPYKILPCVLPYILGLFLSIKSLRQTLQTKNHL
jgi:hypothetical protein